MGLFGYSSKKEENVIPDFKKEEKVILDKKEVKPVENAKVDHKDDFNESVAKPILAVDTKILEKINYKLDLINARLENLNARLEAIERIAYEERSKY